MRKFQRDKRADGLGHHHFQRNDHRKLEVAVKREEDQENQQHGQRPDDVELRLGFEKLAVLAAPIEVVTLWKCDRLFDRVLPGINDALEVAAFHRKLNSNVARIVFTIDEGSSRSLLDAGELRKRNLLAGWRRHQEIANVARARAILRLHAYDQVKKLFALDDLR